MIFRRHRVYQVLLVLLCVLALLSPGQTYSRASPSQDESPPPRDIPTIRGIRVVDVDRGFTSESAWIRIRVLSDTPVPETWEVIRDIPQWDRFLSLFSRVVLLKPEGPMERYRFSVTPPWPISGGEATVRVMERPADRTLDYWVEAGIMQGTYGRISVNGANGKGSSILFENLGAPSQRFPDWMVKAAIYLMVPSILKGLRDQILLQMQQAPET